jgi:hypothetical protein
MNEKQKKTRQSVTKNKDVFDNGDLDETIRSYITHNKGGKWELLKAPTMDSEGRSIKCYIEDECSLHLQIYSSNGIFPPPYSQDSAVGVIMGVGNIGKRLRKN